MKAKETAALAAIAATILGQPALPTGVSQVPYGAKPARERKTNKLSVQAKMQKASRKANRPKVKRRKRKS